MLDEFLKENIGFIRGYLSSRAGTLTSGVRYEAYLNYALFNSLPPRWIHSTLEWWLLSICEWGTDGGRAQIQQRVRNAGVPKKDCTTHHHADGCNKNYLELVISPLQIRRPMHWVILWTHGRENVCKEFETWKNLISKKTLQLFWYKMINLKDTPWSPHLSSYTN
jgi:hypothetical protein